MEIVLCIIIENKLLMMMMISSLLHLTEVGRWVANLVARLLATAALWVRIQTSLKKTKWATWAKERPTHCSPPTKYTKKRKICFFVQQAKEMNDPTFR